MILQDSYPDDQASNQPRVLLVVGFLWGDEGIVKILSVLAKGLIRHGWQVAIASAMETIEDTERFTRGPQWFESQGIRHFFVPFPSWRIAGIKRYTRALPALLQLSSIIRQFNPDVINIHSPSLSAYGQAIQFLYKIPYVLTAHIQPSNNRFGVKLGAFVNHHFNTFLGNRFIAISTELKEAYIKNLNVPGDNVRLICHGVESDHFRPPLLQERIDARTAFGLKPESQVICLIGRLNYRIKGHNTLIRALAILKSEGIDVIALFAGAGNQQEQDSIVQQATQLGVLDLVYLLGLTDARQVLWASDILTLPSKLEGFPLVIPEAMLCGVVPVRTPAAGAFDQIEDGVNGFIVPFDDPETLALRLKQLLENDELRSQMSSVAIESARLKFTVDRMTQDTIAVYKEVLKS